MSDYGIYDKHIKKIIALNKKRGVYTSETHSNKKVPLNPLSDFLKPLPNGHVLTEIEAEIAKIARFCNDVYNAKAFTSNGRTITLGEKGAKLENVDFVAGLWRVQKKFPYKITRVRDKDMVLMNKLNHKENTNFEYWDAKLVGYNCYGPFIIDDKKPDFIVSRCIVNEREFWGYGTTIESARAFLGLKIWDELRDVIHAAVFNKSTKQK